MNISDVLTPQDNIFRTIQKYDQFKNKVNYPVFNIFLSICLLSILVNVINYTPSFLTKEAFTSASTFCIGFFGSSALLRLYSILRLHYFKYNLSVFMNKTFWHPINSKSLYSQTMHAISLPEYENKNYYTANKKSLINRFFTERNIDNLDTYHLDTILHVLLEQELKNQENVNIPEQNLVDVKFFEKN